MIAGNLHLLILALYPMLDAKSPTAFDTMVDDNKNIEIKVRDNALAAAPNPQPSQPGQPPVTQASAGNAEPLTIIAAKVVKEDLMWQEQKGVPVEKTGVREVQKGDIKMREDFKYTVIEMVTIQKSAALKTLEATDASGKAISSDKLAVLLAEPTRVVTHTGPLPENVRSLFRDTTILIEFPLPKMPPSPPPKELPRPASK